MHISKGGETHCSALLSDYSDTRIKAIREASVIKLEERKEISLEEKITYQDKNLDSMKRKFGRFYLRGQDRYVERYKEYSVLASLKTRYP